MKRHLLAFLAAALVVGALAASCGAENDVAPPAEEQPSDIHRCRSFGELMPNFVRALSLGRTENLKRVVEEQLLVSGREGEPPPINDVLRSIFGTLTRLATKPPEQGAPTGEYCALPSSPPPLTQANELCELRRSLDVLVHQGKGIDAVRIAEPQLLGVLKYIEGTGVDQTPHYEVAGVLSNMCSSDANCQMVNGLDLVIAFSQYARTNEGRLMMEHLGALASKQSITDLLNPQGMTEDGFVAIIRTVITVVQGADPSALDNLPIPASAQQDLGPVIADLKLILDPNHVPDLMTPTRKSLTCLNAKDRNMDLGRMIYRLAIRDQLPEFGLTRLTGLLEDLQALDQRGALVYLVGALAEAVRSDEQAIEATGRVCKTLLSTVPPQGQARSNAELIVPTITELVEGGIINEGVCAIDTLLFGCAGGVQPACPGP